MNRDLDLIVPHQPGTDDAAEVVTDEPTTTRSLLYEEVYRQLLRLIERQEFPLGTKLPTELELATRFGVSRPIVRRALELLRDEGFVTTRKGSGTVITSAPRRVGPQFPPLETIADLQQFYEYRIGLEGGIAELAAERRTDADVEAINRALSRSDAALRQSGTSLAADLNFEFHRTIAEAAGNRFYVATVNALPNFVGETPLKQALGQQRQTSYGWQIQREHEGIAAAIIDRRAPEARRLMVEHIATAMRMVFANTRVSTL